MQTYACMVSYYPMKFAQISDLHGNWRMQEGRSIFAHTYVAMWSSTPIIPISLYAASILSKWDMHRWRNSNGYLL
jgi:hypothetical protein